MKKIAIICGSLNRGGAERVSVRLSAWFVSRGYDVRIITAQRGKNEYEPPASVCRHTLTDKNDGLMNVPAMVRRLRTLIAEYEIESVIIMGVSTCLYAVPGCLGKARRLIVSERNAPQQFSGKAIVRIVSRWLMKLCHAYVFQTQDAMDFYARKVTGDKVIIRNPLPVEQLPTPFQGIREKNIVSMGRLEPQKNQTLLLEAFAALSADYPEYRLTLYGEGYLRPQLEKRVRELGLTDRIFLPGNHTDVLEKINNASLFVLPSAYEGMPNALMEAMALGLPCISTDCPCGGPREMMTQGHDGLLVPVNDKEALVQAMRRVLNDKELAEKLGQNALSIREKLDMETVGRQWEALLS